MSNYILSIFAEEVWYTLFVTCFFFGLFFLLIVVLGAFGEDDGADSHGDSGDGMDHGFDHDLDIDTDLDLDTDFSVDHDFGVDHDLSIDHDMSMDHDLDVDANISVDHDLGVDHDLDLDADLSMDHDFDLDAEASLGDVHHEMSHGEVGLDPDKQPKSRFLMGNISSFLLIFGQVGWMNSNPVTDQGLLIAIIAGYVASIVFGWILANYAKTTIVPIIRIARGDIAKVIYEVTPQKKGLVHVYRRDGSISSVIAIGKYPHDFFLKNEKGYIWSKNESNYTITKGHFDQPKLQTKPKLSKVAKQWTDIEQIQSKSL